VKYSLHDNAIVAPEARIGEGVEIGPYSVIGPHVEIGAGTRIGSYVQIDGWTKIGENNNICNSVSLGLPPQNLDYDGGKTHLFIGNNNVVREFVTIHRGTGNTGGETRLGNNNLLMVYSHVAHDCHLGNNIVLSDSANLAGHVYVDDYAYLSRLVGIHQFVKIGRLAMVESHSKLIKDLPPFIKARGHPAQVEGVNMVGLRRYGLPGALKEEIKKAYKLLYESGLNISQAIEEMDQNLQTSNEIEYFINFLKSSTRGICRR